jgi:hypothetical protein
MISISMHASHIADSVSSLNLLGKSLISKNLLLLEYILSKTNLKFDNSLLVNYTTFGSAVIYKEFLFIDHYGLTFFYVAHEPTVEVGI